jgi:hypothetical protein
VSSYFIASGDQPYGPYNSAEVSFWAASGYVEGDTLISVDGQPWAEFHVALSADMARLVDGRPFATAGVGRRFAAVLVDYLLAIPRIFFTWAAVLLALTGMADDSPAGATIGWAGVAVGILGGIPLGFYLWYLQARRGYTWGKQTLGLRIVDADTLRFVGWWRILLRNLVSGLLLVFTFGLGAIVLAAMASADPSGRGRSLHDRAANTRVIHLN